MTDESTSDQGRNYKLTPRRRTKDCHDSNQTQPSSAQVRRHHSGTAHNTQPITTVTIHMKGFNAKPDISILSNFQDKLRKLWRLWSICATQHARPQATNCYMYRNPNFERDFDCNLFLFDLGNFASWCRPG